MDDRKTIAQEIGKTRARLKQMGVDASRLSFSYREDKEDKPQVEDTREIWKADDEFIKLFTNDLVDVTDDLTGTEALALFAIIPFISYETGMLTVGTTYKRPLSNDDIQRMIKKSDTTVTLIMKKLVEKKVLSRNEVGRSYQYFANPYIFFKGRYINKTLIAMFKKYAENRPKR